jgi:hypothetical protein
MGYVKLKRMNLGNVYFGVLLPPFVCQRRIEIACCFLIWEVSSSRCDNFMSVESQSQEHSCTTYRNITSSATPLAQFLVLRNATSATSRVSQSGVALVKGQTAQ